MSARIEVSEKIAKYLVNKFLWGMNETVFYIGQSKYKLSTLRTKSSGILMLSLGALYIFDTHPIKKPTLKYHISLLRCRKVELNGKYLILTVPLMRLDSNIDESDYSNLPLPIPGLTMTAIDDEDFVDSDDEEKDNNSKKDKNKKKKKEKNKPSKENSQEWVIDQEESENGKKNSEADKNKNSESKDNNQNPKDSGNEEIDKSKELESDSNKETEEKTNSEKEQKKIENPTDEISEKENQKNPEEEEANEEGIDNLNNSKSTENQVENTDLKEEISENEGKPKLDSEDNKNWVVSEDSDIKISEEEKKNKKNNKKQNNKKKKGKKDIKEIIFKIDNAKYSKHMFKSICKVITSILYKVTNSIRPKIIRNNQKLQFAIPKRPKGSLINRAICVSHYCFRQGNSLECADYFDDKWSGQPVLVIGPSFHPGGYGIPFGCSIGLENCIKAVVFKRAHFEYFSAFLSTILISSPSVTTVGLTEYPRGQEISIKFNNVNQTNIDSWILLNCCSAMVKSFANATDDLPTPIRSLTIGRHSYNKNDANEVFSIISEKPKLAELAQLVLTTLNFNEFPKQSFTTLCTTLKNLEELEISRVNIDGSEIFQAVCSDAPHIRQLIMKGLKFEKQWFLEDKLTLPIGLIYLDLSENFFTRTTLSDLLQNITYKVSKLPFFFLLRSIRFTESVYPSFKTDFNVSLCQPNLLEFDMSGNYFPFVSYEPIFNFIGTQKRIRNLIFTDVSAENQRYFVHLLASIRSCNFLTGFDLSGNFRPIIIQQFITSISGNLSLKRLSLKNSGGGNGSYNMIQNLLDIVKGLREIEIDGFHPERKSAKDERHPLIFCWRKIRDSKSIVANDLPIMDLSDLGYEIKKVSKDDEDQSEEDDEEEDNSDSEKSDNLQNDVFYRFDSKFSDEDIKLFKDLIPPKRSLPTTMEERFAYLFLCIKTGKIEDIKRAISPEIFTILHKNFSPIENAEEGNNDKEKVDEEKSADKSENDQDSFDPNILKITLNNQKSRNDILASMALLSKTVTKDMEINKNADNDKDDISDDLNLDDLLPAEVAAEFNDSESSSNLSNFLNETKAFVPILRGTDLKDDDDDDDDDDDSFNLSNFANEIEDEDDDAGNNDDDHNFSDFLTQTQYVEKIELKDIAATKEDETQEKEDSIHISDDTNVKNDNVVDIQNNKSDTAVTDAQNDDDDDKKDAVVNVADKGAENKDAKKDQNRKRVTFSLSQTLKNRSTKQNKDDDESNLTKSMNKGILKTKGKGSKNKNKDKTKDKSGDKQEGETKEETKNELETKDKLDTKDEVETKDEVGDTKDEVETKDEVGDTKDEVDNKDVVGDTKDEGLNKNISLDGVDADVGNEDINFPEDGVGSTELDLLKLAKGDEAAAAVTIENDDFNFDSHDGSEDIVMPTLTTIGRNNEVFTFELRNEEENSVSSAEDNEEEKPEKEEKQKHKHKDRDKGEGHRHKHKHNDADEEGEGESKSKRHKHRHSRSKPEGKEESKEKDGEVEKKEDFGAEIEKDEEPLIHSGRGGLPSIFTGDEESSHGSTVEAAEDDKLGIFKLPSDFVDHEESNKEGHEEGEELIPGGSTFGEHEEVPNDLADSFGISPEPDRLKDEENKPADDFGGIEGEEINTHNEEDNPLSTKGEEENKSEKGGKHKHKHKDKGDKEGHRHKHRHHDADADSDGDEEGESKGKRHKHRHSRSKPEGKEESKEKDGEEEKKEDFRAEIEKDEGSLIHPNGEETKEEGNKESLPSGGGLPSIFTGDQESSHGSTGEAAEDDKLGIFKLPPGFVDHEESNKEGHEEGEELIPGGSTFGEVPSDAADSFGISLEPAGLKDEENKPADDFGGIEDKEIEAQNEVDNPLSTKGEEENKSEKGGKYKHKHKDKGDKEGHRHKHRHSRSKPEEKDGEVETQEDFRAEIEKDEEPLIHSGGGCLPSIFTGDQESSHGSTVEAAEDDKLGIFKLPPGFVDHEESNKEGHEEGEELIPGGSTFGEHEEVPNDLANSFGISLEPDELRDEENKPADDFGGIEGEEIDHKMTDELAGDTIIDDIPKLPDDRDKEEPPKETEDAFTPTSITRNSDNDEEFGNESRNKEIRSLSSVEYEEENKSETKHKHKHHHKHRHHDADSDSDGDAEGESKSKRHKHRHSRSKPEGKEESKEKDGEEEKKEDFKAEIEKEEEPLIHSGGGGLPSIFTGDEESSHGSTVEAAEDDKLGIFKLPPGFADHEESNNEGHEEGMTVTSTFGGHEEAPIDTAKTNEPTSDSWGLEDGDEEDKASDEPDEVDHKMTDELAGDSIIDDIPKLPDDRDKEEPPKEAEDAFMPTSITRNSDNDEESRNKEIRSLTSFEYEEENKSETETKRKHKHRHKHRHHDADSDGESAKRSHKHRHSHSKPERSEENEEDDEEVPNDTADSFGLSSEPDGLKDEEEKPADFTKLPSNDEAEDDFGGGRRRRSDADGIDHDEHELESHDELDETSPADELGNDEHSEAEEESKSGKGHRHKHRRDSHSKPEGDEESILDDLSFEENKLDESDELDALSENDDDHEKGGSLLNSFDRLSNDKSASDEHDSELTDQLDQESAGLDFEDADSKYEDDSHHRHKDTEKGSKHRHKHKHSHSKLQDE